MPHAHRVERFYSGTEETIGLMFIDDVFRCFTLEDQFQKNKVHGETRIPAGMYKLRLSYSPRFSEGYGHDLIELLNVPGFSGIRIHKGNTEKHTDGCILPGDTCIHMPEHTSYIGASTSAYNRIYPLLAEKIKNEDTFLEIIDRDRNESLVTLDADKLLSVA